MAGRDPVVAVDKIPDIRVHPSALPSSLCLPPDRTFSETCRLVAQQPGMAAAAAGRAGYTAAAPPRIFSLNCLPQRMEYQRENGFVVNRRARHENN
jgi:hypothetical protein